MLKTYFKDWKVQGTNVGIFKYHVGRKSLNLYGKNINFWTPTQWNYGEKSYCYYDQKYIILIWFLSSS